MRRSGGAFWVAAVAAALGGCGGVDAADGGADGDEADAALECREYQRQAESGLVEDPIGEYGGAPTVVGVVNLGGDGRGGLGALRCLTTVVGNIDIDFRAAPPTLAGLERLRTVTHGLVVGSRGSPHHGAEVNPGLVSLGGLEGLESVGYLGVWGNASLVDLDALGGVRYVGESLTVEGNPVLADSAVAFGELRAVGGSVEIRDNAALRGVELLRAVRAAGGTVTLADLPALSSVAGLRGLVSAGGLELEDLPRLESLAGLEALGSVGALRIQQTGLRSLAGLDPRLRSSAEGGEASVEILFNESLPTCEVEAFVARLRASGWGGEAAVEGNDDTASCE
jgi:hypothetical protein